MTNWSGGAQGALGGAGTGFAIGGPIGGAIGAIGGGLAGFFGGDGGDAESEAMRRKQMELYEELSRNGPAERGAYSEFRQNQRNFINNLEAQSQGRGPSLADAQMRAATDRSTKQSMGLAQSGGGNPAAAMMMAQEASGQMGAQNAQNAMAGRIQEQLNAQQLLGINLHGARGADEDMNRFNASQSNNFGLENNRLRAMVLQGQAGGIPRGPSMGEQILAGGAGAFGNYLGNRMHAKPKSPPPYNGQGLPPSGIVNPWG